MEISMRFSSGKYNRHGGTAVGEVPVKKKGVSFLFLFTTYTLKCIVLGETFNGLLCVY